MRDPYTCLGQSHLNQAVHWLMIGALAFFVPESSHASDWKQFTTTKEGTTLFTQDPSKFPPGDGVRRIRMLINNPPSVNGGGSVVVELEANCSDNKIRTIARTYFGQQNGEGRAGESYRDERAAFNRPEPKGQDEAVMNIACGRKPSTATNPDVITLVISIEELATKRYNRPMGPNWDCFTNVTIGDRAPVKVVVNGRSESKARLGKDWAFQLNRPADFVDPIPIRWDASKEQAARNEVACPWAGDITLVHVYASEWRAFFQKKRYGEQTKACFRIGMEQKGLPIHDWDKRKLERYASPYHSISRQVEQICEELRPDALAQNEDCFLDGLHTKCDSNLYEYVGETRNKVDLKTAVIARLEGRRAENLKLEKAELREERLRAKADADERKLKEQIASDDARRAVVLADAKRAADEEKRRQWLESPEGKKYLASQPRNFLLGLCEIPPKSTLSDCSIEAIAKSKSATASYQVFLENGIRSIGGTTNVVPKEARTSFDFVTQVRYEIIGTDTVAMDIYAGGCVLKKIYKKQMLGIQVTEKAPSGTCSALQQQLQPKDGHTYKMNYRTAR